MKISKSNKISSKKHHHITRGKSHSKSKDKITIGVYINRKMVEKARNHRLNLSRITEQVL